jgi:hypothetical protein
MPSLRSTKQKKRREEEKRKYFKAVDLISFLRIRNTFAALALETPKNGTNCKCDESHKRWKKRERREAESKG